MYRYVCYYVYEVIILSTVQKENEQKIFDAIQNLKDNIFGATQSYTEFCYLSENSEKGYTLRLDDNKLQDFAKELSDTAKNVEEYTSDYSKVLPVFFRMAVMFLTAACNPDDWIFLSIRKLGRTVYKKDVSEQSVFDIMVQDSSHYIKEYFPEGTFNVEYTLFNDSIVGVDLTNFELCVKHALEHFIDNHKLNSLDDYAYTKRILAQINRSASLIRHDILKKVNSQR